MLTDHEQLCSATGVKAGADPRSANSARYFSKLDHPETISLIPLNTRMCTYHISSVLTQPGLSWGKKGGSSPTEPTVFG